MENTSRKYVLLTPLLETSALNDYLERRVEMFQRSDN